MSGMPEGTFTRRRDSLVFVAYDKRVRYVVHPGPVVPRGEEVAHYITGIQLIKLYKLNPIETTIDHKPNSSAHAGWNDYDWNNLTHLYPREDGDYRHPEEYNA